MQLRTEEINKAISELHSQNLELNKELQKREQLSSYSTKAKIKVCSYLLDISFY